MSPRSRIPLGTFVQQFYQSRQPPGMLDSEGNPRMGRHYERKFAQQDLDDLARMAGARKAVYTGQRGENKYPDFILYFSGGRKVALELKTAARGKKGSMNALNLGGFKSSVGRKQEGSRVYDHDYQDFDEHWVLLATHHRKQDVQMVARRRWELARAEVSKKQEGGHVHHTVPGREFLFSQLQEGQRGPFASEKEFELFFRLWTVQEFAHRQGKRKHQKPGEDKPVKVNFAQDWEHLDPRTSLTKMRQMYGEYINQKKGRTTGKPRPILQAVDDQYFHQPPYWKHWSPKATELDWAGWRQMGEEAHQGSIAAESLIQTAAEIVEKIETARKTTPPGGSSQYQKLLDELAEVREAIEELRGEAGPDIFEGQLWQPLLEQLTDRTASDQRAETDEEFQRLLNLALEDEALQQARQLETLARGLADSPETLRTLTLAALHSQNHEVVQQLLVHPPAAMSSEQGLSEAQQAILEVAVASPDVVEACEEEIQNWIEQSSSSGQLALQALEHFPSAEGFEWAWEESLQERFTTIVRRLQNLQHPKHFQARITGRQIEGLLERFEQDCAMSLQREPGEFTSALANTALREPAIQYIDQHPRWGVISVQDLVQMGRSALNNDNWGRLRELFEQAQKSWPDQNHPLE